MLSVHAKFFRQLIGKPLHIRVDSGNDASENTGFFMQESYQYSNVSFIIKCNPRQESMEEWLETVKDSTKIVCVKSDRQNKREKCPDDI